MSTPDTPHGPASDDRAAPADEPTPGSGSAAADEPTPADRPAQEHEGTTPPPGDTSPPPSPGGPTAPPPDDGPPPRGEGPEPPAGDPPPSGGSSGFQLSIGGRRLYRRADDRVVAGVASGIGDFFGVEPAIIRLAFVCLAIFGGSGFFLYAVGWLFMPIRGRGESVGEELLRKVGGPRSAGGIVLLAIAALVILDSLTGFNGSPLFAAVLIGIGVLLFRDDGGGTNRGGQARDEGRTRSGQPVAPMDDQESTMTAHTTHDPPHASTSAAATRTYPQEVYDELPPPPPGLYDDWRPTPQPPPPEPPPPPSILGRLTLAAALILVGGVALIENLTPLDFSTDNYAAMVLVVLGAGLIVGARWGRARGLIALGAVAVLVLTISAAVPNIPGEGVGQRRYAPQVVSDIRQPYELTVGEMIIDLTELELAPNQRATIDAEMGIGSLQLIVPDGVGVEGEATAGLGEVDALDRTTGGSDTRLTFSEPGPEGSPTISMDLQTAVGEIKINRAPAEVGS